jgi:hypothetical protein
MLSGFDTIEYESNTGMELTAMQPQHNAMSITSNQKVAHLVHANVQGVVRLGVQLEAHFGAGQAEGALLRTPRPQHPRHSVE